MKEEDEVECEGESKLGKELDSVDVKKPPTDAEVERVKA